MKSFKNNNFFIIQSAIQKITDNIVALQNDNAKEAIEKMIQESNSQTNSSDQQNATLLQKDDYFKCFPLKKGLMKKKELNEYARNSFQRAKDNIPKIEDSFKEELKTTCKQLFSCASKFEMQEKDKELNAKGLPEYYKSKCTIYSLL